MPYTTDLESDNTHFTLWVTQSYIVVQCLQSPPQFYCILGGLFLLYLHKIISNNIGTITR